MLEQFLVFPLVGAHQAHALHKPVVFCTGSPLVALTLPLGKEYDRLFRCKLNCSDNRVPVIKILVPRYVPLWNVLHMPLEPEREEHGVGVKLHNPIVP